MFLEGGDEFFSLSAFYLRVGHLDFNVVLGIISDVNVLESFPEFRSPIHSSY